MSPNPRIHLPAPRSLGLAALLLVSGSALLSCSPPPTATPAGRVVEATSRIDDPFRTLGARAELEALSPARAVPASLLAQITPDGARELIPGTPAYQRAMTDADAIDARVAALWPSGEPERVDDERRAQAIKLYTRARTLRQTGHSEDAIETLRRAERVDPGSAAIQRELGDTLIVGGDQAGAVRAFERAIELGDRSPRALVHVASQAAGRGDQDKIIALTTLALADPAIDNFPMARAIAATLLGNAQIDAGYLRAGAASLEAALGSFDTGSRDLRWRREIIQILSQRSQLWIRAGDAWSAIGAHERAQIAYERAGSDEGPEPLGLVARQIVAQLRAGHRARAALLLLDHVQHAVGDLGQEELAWAGALSQIPEVGDVLGDAVGSLAMRPGLTPSIERSLLALRVACVPAGRGVELVANAGPLANDPGVLARVLGGLKDDGARYDAGTRIVGANPQIARALADAMSRTVSSPIKLLRTHARARSEGEQLLNTAIGLDMGRPELIGHLGALAVDTLDERSVPWVAMHAQAMALVGDWDRARTLGDELDRRADSAGQTPNEGQRDPGSTVRQLASTRLVLQDPDGAWALAGALSDEAGASVGDLMLGARIARLLNKPEAAVAYLERASELDPYDASVLEQLMLLRGPGVLTGDQEELQYIARRLGTNRPRSALFGLLRANELARNGMVREAETLLLRLNAQHPYAEIGYDLLLSIWKTQLAGGDEDALDQGIAWLTERLGDRPTSDQTALTLAQAYFELDEYERARGVLDATYARTGAFELARASEQLLATQLGEPEAAWERITERLSGLGGVDPTIEFSAALARRGDDASDARLLDLLERHLPEGITLLPAQVSQLEQIVYTLANTIEQRENPQTVLGTIAIIEARTGAIGFNLARIKILLLAQQPRVDLDALLGVVRAHVAQMDTQEQKQTLTALPVQSLIGDNRPHEAIALGVRMATDGGVIDPDYLIETYRMLGALGTSADVIGVIDMLSDRGLMGQAIELTTERLGTPQRRAQGLSPDQQRADLAYTAAAMATAFNRDAQASSFYELSLSYDPDHAWANNDYGYMLADRGERLSDAIRMLKKAADAEPDEASIIDSLAWARYKMGMFEDVVDPQTGELIVAGAISLLQRANTLDTERTNATIVLHLGDALWRAGRHEQSIEAWLSAENMLRSRIRLLSTQPDQNQRAITALSEQLREIRYRIQDAGSTGTPKVAPIIEDPGGDPRDDPGGSRGGASGETGSNTGIDPDGDAQDGPGRD